MQSPSTDVQNDCEQYVCFSLGIFRDTDAAPGLSELALIIGVLMFLFCFLVSFFLLGP